MSRKVVENFTGMIRNTETEERESNFLKKGDVTLSYLPPNQTYGGSAGQPAQSQLQQWRDRY